jgi:hypothetical protein
MAARRFAAVHQRDLDIRFGQQTVREGEAARAAFRSLLVVGSAIECDASD